MLLFKPSTFLAICSIIMLSLLLTDDPHHCHDILDRFISKKHLSSDLLSTDKERKQQWHLFQQLTGYQELNTPFHTGKIQVLIYPKSRVKPEGNLRTSYQGLNENIVKQDLPTKTPSKSKAAVLYQRPTTTQISTILSNSVSLMTNSEGRHVNLKETRKGAKLKTNLHVNQPSKKRRLKKTNEIPFRRKIKSFSLNSENKRPVLAGYGPIRNGKNIPDVLQNNEVPWNHAYEDSNRNTELTPGRTHKSDYSQTWFHSCAGCLLENKPNRMKHVSNQDMLKKGVVSHVNKFGHAFYPKNIRPPKDLVTEAQDEETSLYDTIQQHTLPGNDISSRENYVSKTFNLLTGIEDTQSSIKKTVLARNINKSTETNKAYLPTEISGRKAFPRRQIHTRHSIISNDFLSPFYLLRNENWKFRGRKVLEENIPVKNSRNDSQMASFWKSFIQRQTDRISQPESLDELELSQTAPKNEKHPRLVSEKLPKQPIAPEFLKRKALLKTMPDIEENSVKVPNRWYENYSFVRRKTPTGEESTSGPEKFPDKTLSPGGNEFRFGVQLSKMASSTSHSGNILEPKRNKEHVEIPPVTMVQELLEHRKWNSALNEDVHEERIKRMVPLKEEISSDTGLFPPKRPPSELARTLQLDNKDERIGKMETHSISNENSPQPINNRGITHNIQFDTDVFSQKNLRNVSGWIFNHTQSPKENFNDDSLVKLHNSTADSEHSRNKTVSSGKRDIGVHEVKKIFYSYTDINHMNKSLEGNVRHSSFGKGSNETLSLPGKSSFRDVLSNSTKNYTDSNHVDILSSKDSETWEEIGHNSTLISSGNGNTFPTGRNGNTDSRPGSTFETDAEKNFTLTPNILALNESDIADGYMSTNISFHLGTSTERNVADANFPPLPERAEIQESSDYPLTTVEINDIKVKNLDESFTVSHTGSNITYMEDDTPQTSNDVITELPLMYNVTSQIMNETRTKIGGEGYDDGLYITNDVGESQNETKNKSTPGDFSVPGSVLSEHTTQEIDTDMPLNETDANFENENQVGHSKNITVYANETVTTTTENIGSSTVTTTAENIGSSTVTTTAENIGSSTVTTTAENIGNSTANRTAENIGNSTVTTTAENTGNWTANRTAENIDNSTVTRTAENIDNSTITRTEENIGNSTILITDNITFERTTRTAGGFPEYIRNTTQTSSPNRGMLFTLSEDNMNFSTQEPESNSTQEGEKTSADNGNYGNRGYTKATQTSINLTDYTHLLDTLPATDVTDTKPKQFSSTIKAEGPKVIHVEDNITEEYITQSTLYSQKTVTTRDNKNTVYVDGTNLGGTESQITLTKPSTEYDSDTNTTLMPHFFTTAKSINNQSINYSEGDASTVENNPLNEQSTSEISDQSFSQTTPEDMRSVLSQIPPRGTFNDSATVSYQDQITRDITNTAKINNDQDLTNSMTSASPGVDRDKSLETDYEGSMEKENGTLNIPDKEHRMKRDGNSKEDSTDILPNHLIPKVEINSSWNVDNNGGSDVKNLNPVTAMIIEETILSPTEDKGVVSIETDEKTKILNRSSRILPNISVNQNEITAEGVLIGGINPLGDVSADTDVSLNLTDSSDSVLNKDTSTSSTVSYPPTEDMPPTRGALDNSDETTKGAINDPQVLDIESPDATSGPNSPNEENNHVSEIPVDESKTTSVSMKDNKNENRFSTTARNEVSEKPEEITKSEINPLTSGTSSDSPLNNKVSTSSLTNDPVGTDSPPVDTTNTHSSPSNTVTITTDGSSSNDASTSVPRETTRPMSTSEFRSDSSSEPSSSSNVKTSSSKFSTEIMNNQMERSSSTRSSVEIMETTLESSTMVSVIPFHFTINADYDKVVGNRKEEFENSLKVQLAKVMRLPHDCITDVKVTRGSVEVSFNLIPNPTYGHLADEEAIKAAADELKRKIDNGELNIEDLDGNTLVIVPIDPPMTPPPILEKEHTTLILGIVIGLCVITVITVAIIAVVVKNKSLGRHRLSPIEEARSKMPSYREIPFQEALYVKGNGRGLHQGKYCYDSGRWLGPGPEPMTAAPNPAAYRPPTDLEIRNTQRPSTTVRARLKNNWDLDWKEVMPDR